MLLFAVAIVGESEVDSYVLVTWAKGQSQDEARQAVVDAIPAFEQLRGRSLSIYMVEIPADQVKDIDGKGDVDLNDAWFEGLKDLDIDFGDDIEPLAT